MGLPNLNISKLRKVPAVALTNEAPGTGLVARCLKMFVDIAYLAMATATVVLGISFIVAIFVPLTNFSITSNTGSEVLQMPLTRGLLLFALGLIWAYFSGFFYMLRQLRKIFASLVISDPFQPANVLRLRLIGIVLTLVTFGGWIAKTMAARHLVPGALEAPSLTELLTPTFAIIIVFVLSEVFREGSRLRRDSELTI